MSRNNYVWNIEPYLSKYKTFFLSQKINMVLVETKFREQNVINKTFLMSQGKHVSIFNRLT